LLRCLIEDLDEFMTVVAGILLAVSIAVFVYLGIAMFMPERF